MSQKSSKRDNIEFAVSIVTAVCIATLAYFALLANETKKLASSAGEDPWPPAGWQLWSEPPRDGLITVEIGDHLYRLPHGYLMTPRQVKDLKPVNRWGGMAVAFWMPDGRWTERRASYEPMMKPRERNRPEPGPGEFVVIVGEIRAFSRTDGPRPERLLGNVISVFGPDAFTYQARDRMLEMTPGRVPDRGGPFVNYFGSAGGYDGHFFLRCLHGTQQDGCAGPVFFDDLSLSAHVHMPWSETAQFIPAIRKLHAFLVSWRVQRGQTQLTTEK